MQYILIFKRIDKICGKCKTDKQELYNGEDYSQLLIIQSRVENTALHSVSRARQGNVITVTITENNA